MIDLGHALMISALAGWVIGLALVTAAGFLVLVTTHIVERKGRPDVRFLAMAGAYLAFGTRPPVIDLNPEVMPYMLLAGLFGSITAGVLGWELILNAYETLCQSDSDRLEP